jgi:integrase
VLKQEIGWIADVERAKRPKRLPVVLTRDEIHKIFGHLHGMARLMAGLLYGSGLRLMECVRLRVKDVDFGHAHIVVRDGKRMKDCEIIDFRTSLFISTRTRFTNGKQVFRMKSARSPMVSRMRFVLAQILAQTRQTSLGLASMCQFRASLC